MIVYMFEVPVDLGWWSNNLCATTVTDRVSLEISFGSCLHVAVIISPWQAGQLRFASISLQSIVSMVSRDPLLTQLRVGVSAPAGDC